MSDKNQKEEPDKFAHTLPESSNSESSPSGESELNSSAFEIPLFGEQRLSGIFSGIFSSSTKKEPNSSEKEENRKKVEKEESKKVKKEEEENRKKEESETMSASAKLPQIECFDGKNFSSWMAQMEAILFLSELWIDLNSTDEFLATPANVMKAKKAYMHIVMRCDKAHVNFLQSEAKDNSVHALKLLKSKYDRDSTINKVAELRLAMLMRYNRGSLSDHISQMQAHYQRLKCHGLDLPQLVQAANLIISMPQEFDGVVGGFLRMKDSELNFQDLAEALLDEEKRRSLMNFKPPEDLAQVSTFQHNNKASTSQNPNQQSDKRPEKSKRCSNCNKKGHYAKICRLPNKHGQNSANEGSNNRNNHSTSIARAKFSEYNNTDEEQRHDSMYSHVAYVGKFEPKARSRSNRRVNEFQSFRRNKLKSIIVKVDNKKIAEHKVVAKEVAQGPSKRLKNCEEAKDYVPLSTLFSPGGERSVMQLPTTPGKEIDCLSDISPAGSQCSISNISKCESPILSIDGTVEDWNKEFEIYETCFTCNSVEKGNSSNWILDSGASLHMSSEKLKFQDLILKPGGVIRIANGGFMNIEGFGKVKVIIKTKSEPIVLFLNNVAFVPALHINLMSVRCLTKDKFKILFEKQIAKIEIKNDFVQIAEVQNNNYIVSEAPCEGAMLCIDELHKRMAHRNIRDIKRLSKFGLAITKCSCSHQCDACMKAKSTDLSFPQKSEKPEKPLDIIVADVCGPIRVQSLGGRNYFLTITDLHSDYTEVKFLRNKSDAKVEIRNYIEFVKNQVSQKPKIFRTDRGGEFVDNELQAYLKDQGVKIEFTTPDSPQQNGVAERKNRTLNDAVRTLFISSQLPENLWPEAMNNVVYTYNRIVRKGKEASPIEIFFNKVAKGKFIEFGSEVYVNTRKQNRGKFDPHAIVMRFLSVDDNSKGFRLWTGNKVVIERNMRSKLNVNLKYENPITETNLCNNSFENLEQTKVLNICTDDSNEKTLRRSKRIADKKILSESANVSNIDGDPKSYKEAISRVDCKEWIKAMNEEINSLKETQTYELTDLPPNKIAIGCKWVFKQKSEKGVSRYKARLVAQGFSQKYGEEYDEVFAPVARAPTIRLLLSLAGKRNLVVKQFDVKTAFLNGDLAEEIYMRQPTGFKIGEKVLRLRKSLYGLKQAARSWNTKLDKSLIKCGFKQSEADDCLYIKKSGKERFYIVCHVDDMVFAATTNSQINETFERLSEEFDMKDLGHVQEFLGVEFHKSVEGYEINQSKYIAKIANELGVGDSKPQKYPIDPGYYGIKCDEFLPCNNEFRKIIGMLLYVSTHTRPDISASVCILAQRVEKPRKIDLTEALRVVKYLNGTKEHKLRLYNTKKPQDLLAYSDANFAECKIEGKSNSGLICFINGGPIVWKCRKQTNVALSTCEAEYYAITEATKEVLWLHTLMNDFEIEVCRPTIILNDNQSTIAMITNGDFMQRTKYIGVKYHFIRDWIKKQIIDVKYCPTEHNIADLLTKPLAGIRIAYLRTAAGICET